MQLNITHILTLLFVLASLLLVDTCWTSSTYTCDKVEYKITEISLSINTFTKRYRLENQNIKEEILIQSDDPIGLLDEIIVVKRCVEQFPDIGSVYIHFKGKKYKNEL